MKPGSQKSGFTLVMENANSQLLSGHWTAIIDGPPTYASSRLKMVEAPAADLDTIPPSITVSVEPSVIWPPNNKIVSVVANVAASDDKDPSPAISLVSVSCNDAIRL